MKTIEFGGKIFVVDEEGFLQEFGDWCPEWVEYVKAAQQMGELTADHWKLMKALQAHYRETGVPPIARVLSRVAGLSMTRIFELFPQGPGKGACRMAGLPKPKGCV